MERHHPFVQRYVAVLEDGSDRDAELLEKSGYYRRLYDLQFNQRGEESTAERGILVEELV